MSCKVVKMPHVSVSTGVSSALTALDVTAFDKFMALVHDFLRDEPSHKEDMYEVTAF